MASQFNNFYPIDNYSQNFNLLENFESTTTDKSVAVVAEKITKKLPSVSKKNAEKQAKTILDVTRPLAKKALATKQVLTKKDVNDVAVVAVAQHVLKASPNISVSQANQKAINIVKPTSRPTRKATSKATSRPTRKVTSKSTSRPTSKSTSRPTRKSTSRPTRKVASKSTSRPTRKAVSKSTSRPKRKATSKPTLNPATYKPTIRAIAKQLVKTVPGVTPKQAVKQAIKTLKATSKPTKVRRPNSSHNDAYYKANPNRLEQDILDVSKWLQEKHPNKSPTSYRNYAIYQLRTSRHSLGYLKGNASARTAWAGYLKSLKNKKTSRPTSKKVTTRPTSKKVTSRPSSKKTSRPGSKKVTTRPGSKKPTTKPVASKIKAAVRSVLVSGNKANTVLVTAPTKAAAQKKASKVAMESNKFVVKK